MSTIHYMKTARRGRNFIKDIHDLFATLIVALPLTTNRQFLKSYPYSFTTDQAATNLANLKFSQSSRSPDPKDPGKIVTTTTTTTFSMTRDMAKGICQHFMEARLIESASDPGSITFKDRGVYVVTPKGLHILERFITKNGIAAEHLVPVFNAQPICMKLLHLERRQSDDEIVVTRAVIEILFRRFAGREPNISKLSNEQFDSLQPGSAARSVAASAKEHQDRAAGIPLRKYAGGVGVGVSVKGVAAAAAAAKSDAPELVFYASQAVDWLVDFAALVSREESCEMLAHFVRYGFIKVVQDKASRWRDSSATTTTTVVRAGGAASAAGAMVHEGEFRHGDKVLYKITLEGAKCARWDENAADKHGGTLDRVDSSQLKSANRFRPSDEATAITPPGNIISNTTDNKLMRRTSVSDRLRREYLDQSDGKGSLACQISMDSSVPGQPFSAQKDSHTSRLRQIIEEPVLRSLFREFLRSNLCEENLSFWLEVQDFKRKFNTTSSAVGASASVIDLKSQGATAMEKHHTEIITMAFVIYNTFLAPGSECELNIDHNLREELVAYMNKVFAEIAAKESGAIGDTKKIDPAVAARNMAAIKLHNLVKLYERIQGYIFRLMATDSVPKFCKTSKYIELMESVFDISADLDTTKSATKALDEMDMEDKPSGAYITISQAANEKQAALQKKAQTTHRNGSSPSLAGP